MMQRGSVPQLYTHINGKQNLGEVRSGVASTKTGIKDGFDEEEHAFPSGTLFFR